MNFYEEFGHPVRRFMLTFNHTYPLGNTVCIIDWNVPQVNPSLGRQ